MSEIPLYGVLDSDGLRDLASYLDDLVAKRGESGVQVIVGQLLVPSDAEESDSAWVAFRWDSDRSALPRVCLFGSNEDSPEDW